MITSQWINRCPIMSGIFSCFRPALACIICDCFLMMLVMTYVLSGCTAPVESEDGPIKVMILTGRNNHEWDETTAALVKMYQSATVFEVTVTYEPDTLTYDIIKDYDLLVGNWNNWPENEAKWDPVQEEAFRRFVENGGGTVFFHAGGSSYYSSDIYHEIALGRWGPQTSHGEQTTGKVYAFDQEHPVTQGMSPFFMEDELWENPEIHPEAVPIGKLEAKDKDDGHLIREDAVFVRKFGDGRCFYTILGHDERALFNTGLQTLLLRASEWAATGKVTQEMPQNLRGDFTLDESSYRWHQSDTTLELSNNGNTIWQYNFRNRFGKSYFHPIYLKNYRITCESPRDHVWHYGLWFSWKFINGLNYWEYTEDYRSEQSGFRSEGRTEISDIRIQKNHDFSANFDLDIVYRPWQGGDPVLREQRKIFVSRPEPNGEYYFDYEHQFSAEYGTVTIDRTPILGEADGMSWGGYGGLTIRINQDYTHAETIPAYPPVTPPDYPVHDWFCMKFKTLTGSVASVAMFQHPDYTTESTRWYFTIDKQTPFIFFSPAAVYSRKIVLNQGDSLILKYRVWILPDTSEEIIQEKFHHYIYD